MKTLLRATTVLGFLVAVSTASGQKIDTKSIDLAIERAEESAKILKDITALPDDKGIPKDLKEQSILVGVVPDAARLSLLVSRTTVGHGILSERKADKSWGLPLFISYNSSPGFKFSSAGGKRMDLVFAVTLERSATTGAKRDTVKIKTYTYAFADGDLKLINTESLSNDSFFALSGFFNDSSRWRNDELLNKAVYGVKGREVDAGKVTKPMISSPAITDFRDTLNHLFAIK